MTRLSVNINKVATLRNARGGNLPNVLDFALACESYAADGITVHPRPDERHITRKDVYDIKEVIAQEFNIEGNPEPAFIDLVLDVKPAQVTLVPDAPAQLTSNHGWDTKTHLAKLSAIIQRFKNLDGEVERKRTEQSFSVPKQEIVDNDYDLSINKYKEVEYVPVQYPSTLEIMTELRALEMKIAQEMDALEQLLGL